jgi:hypothetical protein
MKTTKSILFFGLLALTSCNLSNVNPDKALGGDPLALAQEGNTFRVYTALEGVGISDVKVADVSADGVSTTTLNINVTNEKLLQWRDSFPYLNNVNGNSAELNLPGRVTTEGIQSVHNGDNFTLIKFDAKVGDKYQGKINGKTVVREVMSKSTEDDYAYGFFDIKVYRIEERGLGLPGLQKINYYVNHRFGIVGIEAVFEDGSTENVSVFSDY